MKKLFSFLLIHWKGLSISAVALIALGFGAIAGIYQLVENSYSSEIYQEIIALPMRKVGVVPGTIPTLANGQPNPYFVYRIEAAAAIFKADKIEFILVSGDNSRHTYDESSAMKLALIKAGVPAARIYVDYAGFSTLDTVLRAQKIFGLNEFTFISQPFHNKRAVYIAKAHAIDAIAYNAQAITGRAGSFVKRREVLARVKMFLDLYLLHSEPHFLGAPITISEQTPQI